MDIPGQRILCRGNRALHRRTYSSILGLYPLDGSTPSCNNQKCLQTLPNVPWQTKQPWLIQSLSGFVWVGHAVFRAPSSSFDPSKHSFWLLAGVITTHVFLLTHQVVSFLGVLCGSLMLKPLGRFSKVLLASTPRLVESDRCCLFGMSTCFQN